MGMSGIQKVSLHVHCYEVDGVLIDTSIHIRQKIELSSFIERVNIDQVVMIHHHEGHTGEWDFYKENMDIPR